MRKQLCDQLITETEQSLQKMGLDLYETMQRAGALVERWKQYIPLFQEVWNHASNREQLTALLITGPDPSPEEMETVLTLIRTVPFLLRSSLQDATKSLPPSPGGRPPELNPEQRKQICHPNWAALRAGGRAARCSEAYGAALQCRPANYTKGLARARQVEFPFLKRKKWELPKQDFCRVALKTNVRANITGIA